MAQNFWTAIFAWTTCFAMTILISLATKRTKSDTDLEGLVYWCTPKPKADAAPWWKRPAALAVIVLAMTLVLNIIFF